MVGKRLQLVVVVVVAFLLTATQIPLAPPAWAVPILIAVKDDGSWTADGALWLDGDGLVVDVDGDGAVDPGDTLRYMTGVANAGNMSAVNVSFADTVDFATTVAGSSVSVTPIARNVLYLVEENVPLVVPAGSGVLINDNDPDGGSVSVYSVADSASNVGIATATTSGGSVTVASDGSFVYSPPLDFAGVDSFVYEVIDDEGQTDPAGVIFSVSPAPTVPGLGSAPGLPSGGVSVSTGEVTADLGQLDPGQVVHVFFDVIVGSEVPFGSICNQAVYTSDNHAAIFTDNPATGAINDATCTSIDLSGQDVEDPTWTVPSDLVVSTDPAASTAVVDFVATPADNVGVVSSSCVPATGATFPLGTTTVNCTADDAAGNTGIAAFDVTVEDTEAPTWSVPADITKTATGLDGAIVDYTATPSDNVAVTSSSCVPASGSTFPVGTTTVTCTAADAAGNVGTATFDVTVDVSDGSVDTLIDEIEDLGLPGGVEKSLLAPLKRVDQLLNDSKPNNDSAACDKLVAFVDKVAQRLSDGSVTDAEADALTTFAQALHTEHECA